MSEDGLDESEVVTRMMKVLHSFKIVNLEELNMKASWEDMGLDSLESTAIITSLEHEFHIVFEDYVFDHFENLD